MLSSKTIQLQSLNGTSVI